MLRGSVPGRRHVDLAWIGLGIGDELGNGLGRKRWIGHHHAGVADNSRNGGNVAYEVEIKLFVERGGDRVCRKDQKERMAVGGRTHDRLRGDIAGSAGPAFDDEWLAEPLREPMT